MIQHIITASLYCSSSEWKTTHKTAKKAAYPYHFASIPQSADFCRRESQNWNRFFPTTACLVGFCTSIRHLWISSLQFHTHIRWFRRKWIAIREEWRKGWEHWFVFGPLPYRWCSLKAEWAQRRLHFLVRRWQKGRRWDRRHLLKHFSLSVFHHNYQLLCNGCILRDTQRAEICLGVLRVSYLQLADLVEQ